MDSFPRTANPAGHHLLFRALTHFLSPYLLLSFPYTLFSSQFLPFLDQSFPSSSNSSFLLLLPPSPGPTFLPLPASFPVFLASSHHLLLLLCSLPPSSVFTQLFLPHFFTLLLLPSFTGTYFPPITYFLHIHTSSSSLPPSSFSHPTSSLSLTPLSSQSVFP